jgi:hypothetical protein
MKQQEIERGLQEISELKEQQERLQVLASRSLARTDILTPLCDAETT